MKEIEVQVLIERCVAYFEGHNYTDNRVSKYKSLWRNGICKFLKKRGKKEYNPKIGEEFIKTCHYNGKVRHQEQEKIRSIHVLDDMLINGNIRKRVYNPVFHELIGDVGQEMEKLITHLTNLRRSKKTISDYRLYLSQFLKSLTEAGVLKVGQIAELHIISFISSCTTTRGNFLTVLRSLFTFWRQEGILIKVFDDLFDSLKSRRKEKIPSFYTSNEIAKAENSIERSSMVGKRDYAMFLIASRLGLRASDIAGLQFENFDWDQNTITIKMQKTKKLMALPLVAAVGNALIDYLQNGRPNSPLNSIFLSSRAPYVGATSGLVSSAINRAMCNSGISTKGKHHGPHSLRHTLACTLLNNGTELPTISEVLGHKNTQTTMAYLKIDIASLQKCALVVPKVSEAFYMQKGGVFYE